MDSKFRIRNGPKTERPRPPVRTRARATASAPNASSVNVVGRQGETLQEALARATLRPEVQAALTLVQYNAMLGEVSGDGLVRDLIEQCDEFKRGDLSRAEVMLAAQAVTLDSIFQNLSRRAAMNINGGYPAAASMYLSLGLKAQRQSRATVETLALIKNPQTVFVRQTNVAGGHQQITNNAQAAAEVPVGKLKNRPDKVLERSHGERLDSTASQASSNANPPVETVATVNWPKDSRRKGKG